MDLGFWRHTGRREEPWEEIPLLVLHRNRFVPVFLPFASRTQSQSGKNGTKFPLNVSRKVQALLSPFPLFQENFANSALQEGAKQEKSISPLGILCFPAFLRPRGFLGCQSFHHGEIFVFQRILGCSDLELPPNPFNSNLFQTKQRRVWQREFGIGSKAQPNLGLSSALTSSGATNPFPRSQKRGFSPQEAAALGSFHLNFKVFP